MHLNWKLILFVALFSYGAYQHLSQQSFELEARVLSAEHYTFDRPAAISTVDLALGWGRMSDEAVLNKIDISQSGRFYFWRVEAFPIPRKEIERSSANMHMVPANDDVQKVLKSIKQGQIVSIKGELIEAESPDGWRWKSSLSRNDTGAGACEVVYVKQVAILN